MGCVICLAGLFAFGQTVPSGSEGLERPSDRPSRRAAVVEIVGPIDDWTFHSMKQRFTRARAEGADTIILVLETPGGLVSSALDISRFLKQQQDLEVVAFVRNDALSAGALIAVACDAIYMAPLSKIGDCAPIMTGMDGGLVQLGGAERAKVESPILEDFRESAARNGHDPLLLESMVTVGRTVHYLQGPTGEYRFVHGEEASRLKSDGWTTVPGVRDPLDDETSLLTLHSDLALRVGLIRGIFDSPASLAADQGWTIVSTLPVTFGDRVMQLLGSAAVRGILLAIFMTSLYLSMSHPGHGAPEAVCAIALGTLLTVPAMTGHAQWYEIVAVILGIVLIAVELFIIPGFGVAGFTGAALLLGGLVMTFVGKEPRELPGVLPSLSGTWDALWRGIVVVTAGLGASFGLMWWLSRFLPSIPYMNKLVLRTTVGSTPEASSYPEEVGGEIWPPLGAVGRAVTDLRPGGSAAFADELTQDLQTTDVVSDSGFIPVNTQVVVHQVQGNRVVVRRADA